MIACFDVVRGSALCFLAQKLPLNEPDFQSPREWSRI